MYYQKRMIMYTQLQKDFLATRKSIDMLRSRIDKLQGECSIAYDLGFEDKAEQLENSINYAFDKIFNLEDSFSLQHKVDYYEIETNWLINGKKF